MSRGRKNAHLLLAAEYCATWLTHLRSLGPISLYDVKEILFENATKPLEADPLTKEPFEVAEATTESPMLEIAINYFYSMDMYMFYKKGKF